MENSQWGLVSTNYTSQTITSILYLVSFRCILKEDDLREMIIVNNDERERESEGSVVCEGFYFLYRMNIKTPPLIILLKPSKVRMIMMDEASKRIMNEWMLFLPQGGVRRRPKKVPLSFSALARGALQAPGCAEDRHSPPAGPPEGRRRQWCAKK